MSKGGAGTMDFFKNQISRREIIKRSVAGMLVIGPLWQWSTVLNAQGYNLCDQVTCKVRRQYCSGNDLIRNVECVDRYNPGYSCYWTVYVWVDHPACRQQKTAIMSVANGLIAAAELGYGGAQWGEVRARTNSGSGGSYEDFTLVPLSGYTYDSSNPTSTQYGILLEQYGLWVSAEVDDSGGYYGMLRARASAIGAWEQYNLISLENGYWAIQSNANGLYVSTEIGYGGIDYAMLRARASSIGPWEQYYIYSGN